jgi:hypothetical protein
MPGSRRPAERGEDLVKRGWIALVVATIAAALLTGATSDATAKDKPTTTTSTTTTTTPPTPKLGVPHVEVLEYTSSDPLGPEPRTLNCPVGEVALSFSWSGHLGDGSPFTILMNQPSVRPVLTNGTPTGYEFWGGSNPPIAHAYVTCAPVAA